MRGGANAVLVLYRHCGCREADIIVRQVQALLSDGVRCSCFILVLTTLRHTVRSRSSRLTFLRGKGLFLFLVPIHAVGDT